VHQRDDGGEEIASGLREPILVALRVAAVEDAFKYPGVDRVRSRDESVGRMKQPANRTSECVIRCRRTTGRPARAPHRPILVGHLARLAWLRSGELRSHEDIVPGGVVAFPDTLLRLFRGENTGKLVLALGAGSRRSRSEA
jgi:hypothetical protein